MVLIFIQINPQSNDKQRLAAHWWADQECYWVINKQIAFHIPNQLIEKGLFSRNREDSRLLNFETWGISNRVASRLI